MNEKKTSNRFKRTCNRFIYAVCCHIVYMFRAVSTVYFDLFVRLYRQQSIEIFSWCGKHSNKILWAMQMQFVRFWASRIDRLPIELNKKRCAPTLDYDLSNANLKRRNDQFVHLARGHFLFDSINDEIPMQMCTSEAVARNAILHDCTFAPKRNEVIFRLWFFFFGQWNASNELF